MPVDARYRYGPMVTAAAAVRPIAASQALSSMISRKSCPGLKPTASMMPNSRRRSITLTKSVLKMPAATSTASTSIMILAPPTFMAMNTARSGCSSCHASTATSSDASAPSAATTASLAR